MPTSSHHAALELFETHRHVLERAVQAVAERSHWSAYPENIKQYPQDKVQSAEANFQALLGRHFVLQGPAAVARAGTECSPYGLDLGISYDQYDSQALLERMQQAMPSWRDLGVQARLGACLEILARLNDLSAEMAYAVMHTTGQGYMMAFQAGGPHAQDRGLEALAYASRAMVEVPDAARWSKPVGKQTLVLDKQWLVVGRGLSLVVACATFPTWNTYPGLFASLATGNPVLIKAHPAAILPVAMTVKVAQQVLVELGLDPALVSLVVDTVEAPVSQILALDPRVKLVDFTGSNTFGNWLENNARQAQVFTEKAGVNSVIIDSIADLKAATGNLALSLSLYSGQMCTTPQTFYVPRTGIQVGDNHLSFDETCQALAQAVEAFLCDNDRACSVLGAIQSQATFERVDACRELGEILLDSQVRVHPQFPRARVRTPLLLMVDASQRDAYAEERFGPISFIVATDSTEHSLHLASKVIKEKGAMTLGVYSTDETVIEKAEQLALNVAVALSINFDGGLLVNQSAAFSDFHATGGNPAANASITDVAFVARRFVVVQSRRHATLTGE
ncbi:MAG: phenylacetic acid degradation protein PaaN [Aeromonas veronii]